MTTASNVMPFGLFDVLLIAAIGAWLAMSAVEWRRRHTAGHGLARIALRTLVWASALYLVFLASWGFNYRRVRLTDKLAFHSTDVNADAVAALVSTAVSRLN